MEKSNSPPRFRREHNLLDDEFLATEQREQLSLVSFTLDTANHKHHIDGTAIEQCNVIVGSR